MDGNFLDVTESGSVSSGSLSQPKAPNWQSTEAWRSLSTCQLLAKCLQNQSGVGKMEISPRMEVSRVGITAHRRSAENSIHVSRSPSKKSCQPGTDLPVDDVTHDTNKHPQSYRRRWTNSRRKNAARDSLPVNTDDDSVCDAENCDRSFSWDNGDSSTSKLSKNNSSCQFDDSAQCSASSAMQSDDLIGFIKREVESPTLTIKSEASSCTTENGTNAAENETLDMRCSEEVTNLASTDHSYWQPELQYNVAFNLNSSDVLVNGVEKPIGTVDKTKFVVRQNKNQVSV